MIRKLFIAVLVLLAVGLLCIGWAGEHALSFGLCSELQVLRGNWMYLPRDWPLEPPPRMPPRASIYLDFHRVDLGWVSIGATNPKRTKGNRLYTWIDESWNDRRSGAFRLRALCIRAPVLPLLTALCLIYPAVAFARGPCLRFNRRRQGRCLKCGYSLIGNTSEHCPECGLDRATQAFMRARNQSWTRRSVVLAIVAMLALGSWATLSEIRDAEARLDVEKLWGELALFYAIPPALIRASDKVASDLVGIVGHPDYGLAFFEPRILADKAARDVLSRTRNWADLIIAIQEIRNGRRSQALSPGAESHP